MWTMTFRRFVISTALRWRTVRNSLTARILPRIRREYFVRLREADNEMKLAEIYNHVGLERTCPPTRRGAQVPSLNGRLFRRSL
jgi:hypothetical protein